MTEEQTQKYQKQLQDEIKKLKTIQTILSRGESWKALNYDHDNYTWLINPGQYEIIGENNGSIVVGLYVAIKEYYEDRKYGTLSRIKLIPIGTKSEIEIKMAYRSIDLDYPKCVESLRIMELHKK